jgi:hypothetical protein
LILNLPIPEFYFYDFTLQYYKKLALLGFFSVLEKIQKVKTFKSENFSAIRHETCSPLKKNF